MDRNIAKPEGFSRTDMIARRCLVGALIANATGHSFILIVMPSLGRVFGFGDMQTGLLVGMSALLLALSGPFWGAISDRKGRRPVLLTALISAVGFLLLLAGILYKRAAFDHPGSLFAVLLCARLVQVGLGGGLMPAAQAWLADRSGPQQRASAMALMGSAFGLGSILGGIVAWLMSATALLPALGLIAGFILFTIVGLVLTLQDDPHKVVPQQASSLFPANGGRINLYGLVPFLMVTVCGLSVYGLLYQVTPLRLQDVMGFSAEQAMQQSGRMMMLSLAGMVVAQGIGVRMLRWRPAVLLQSGAIMAILAMIGAVAAPTLLPLTLSMIFLGISLGLLIPGNLALLSLAVGPDAQARGAGINAIAQGIGMAAGPVAGAGLYQVSEIAPYVLNVFLLVLIGVISLFLRRKYAFAV
ncbi:MFS transporter [Thalassospira profundimaris]|uniref:MFS transporter n=1 Tax=Thalassospira profundimaris TaxID=502049 RepID=UPI0015F07EDC|nr:MFS transporter [Thalassospira profundimaris]